jgi:hypothetical protein
LDGTHRLSDLDLSEVLLTADFSEAVSTNDGFEVLSGD